MANPELFSLLVGLVIALLLLFVLTQLSVISRVIGSWVTWCYDIKHLRSLPCPPGRSWILGHASKLGPTESTMKYLQENLKEYPKGCLCWIGPLIPELFVADVDTMKSLLQRPEEPKSKVYEYLHPWIGDGLLTTSGEKWRRHRKMLTPAFHFDILKQYIPVYNEVAHKLLEIWSPAADTGESVEITEYISCYTLDVLLRCIYSTNSHCLEDKEKVTYVTAIRSLTDLFMNRVFAPHYYFDWIYNWSPAGRKFHHYSDVVHRFSEDVIMQRREELLKGTQASQPARKYPDFLDILLSAKDEDGKGLTDTEIRDEADTFMFEGHDTTAAGINWTLYCLAMHKEHQELCRKEIREILAGRDSDDITWEDLSKLVYTTMCIKESLRLYPPVPYIGKELTNEIVVEGYKIPNGIWLGLGISTMHYDPLVWDDPEMFNPLRFTAENVKKMDPFAYLTFSAGPRNCIGQRFALHELKVTVAHILNRFQLAVDMDHTVERQVLAVLKAKEGIKLKLASVPKT